MPKRAGRTERERPAKASEVVRNEHEVSIAAAASQIVHPLMRRVERVLAKIDDDGVREKRIHRLRSELRRAEILLGTLGCGFADAEVAELVKVVRKVRKAAGGVRDADVGAAVIGRVWRAEDEQSVKARNEVLRALASQRRRAAQRVAKLAAKERGSFLRLWREIERKPAGLRAALPARCAANVALAREAEAMHDAITEGLASVEALHSLRLNLKEARAVMEFLGDVLGPAATELAVRASKLSDVFGDVNDLAALGELLREAGEDAKPRRQAAIAVARAFIAQAHAREHPRAVKRAGTEARTLAAEIHDLATGEHTSPVKNTSAARPPVA